MDGVLYNMRMENREAGECGESKGAMGAFKRFIIVSMVLAFGLMALTGIVKFPELKRYFLFIYDYFPASEIAFIHNWSGIVSIVLILIHMFLKRRSLLAAFGGSRRGMKGASVFIGLSLIACTAIYLNAKHAGGEDRTITLPAVEIKEYQNEKLGSSADFRENSIKGPQKVDVKSYKLQIAGLVVAPAVYSYGDILKLQAYRKVVTLHCVEGWDVKVLWEGVLVKDLLKKIKIKPQARTIIFYAADGYSTSFPLAYVLQNDIILAGRMNGAVLPAERGFPFQLVAENKWGYKWIKWVTRIELSGDANYKGFWEKRGYNNDGDQSGSKFAE